MINCTVGMYVIRKSEASRQPYRIMEIGEKGMVGVRETDRPSNIYAWMWINRADSAIPVRPLFFRRLFVIRVRPRTNSG